MPVVPAPAPEEMPRIAIALLVSSNVSPGVKRATSAIDLAPLASRLSWPNALTLIGTRESSCSCRVAVTTISPGGASSGVGEGGGVLRQRRHGQDAGRCGGQQGVTKMTRQEHATSPSYLGRFTSLACLALAACDHSRERTVNPRGRPGHSRSLRANHDIAATSVGQRSSLPPGKRGTGNCASTSKPALPPTIRSATSLPKYGASTTPRPE